MLELLAALPDGEDLLIVGGQALNFWAERFPDCTDLEAHQPYASKDMDVFGKVAAARRFAKSIGGKVLERDPNNPVAFVEAVVALDERDRQTSIDFLNYVLGTKPADVVKHAVEFEVPVPEADRQGHGRPAVIRFRVMHPLHVLQSRIANVEKLEVGAPPHSSTSTATPQRPRRRQANAAPIILREYVEDRLREADRKEAQGTLLKLAYWLRHEGARSHLSTDNDPLRILKDFEADVRLDERWLQFNLAPAITGVERSRALANRGVHGPSQAEPEIDPLAAKPADRGR